MFALYGLPSFSCKSRGLRTLDTALELAIDAFCLLFPLTKPCVCLQVYCNFYAPVLTVFQTFSARFSQHCASCLSLPVSLKFMSADCSNHTIIFWGTKVTHHRAEKAWLISSSSKAFQPLFYWGIPGGHEITFDTFFSTS